MSRKKPTAMELKKVLESLIKTIEQMQISLTNLNVLFLHYIEYQGKTKDFSEYLQKQEEKHAKQRDISESPNKE